MKVFILLLLVLFYYSWSQEQSCVPCDPNCGDWSCLTNCPAPGNPLPSNPTFDSPRCFVDTNGNGMADDCKELQSCLYMNGQYVCPADVSDPVCNGSCVASGVYGDIRYYDTDPANFDSTYRTYALSKQAITWNRYNSNTCGWQQPDVNMRNEIWSLYGSSQPYWIQGGILYSDAWFSFQSCGNYIDFSGRCWMQREANCGYFPYQWQRLDQRCLPESWTEQFYIYRYQCSANWQIYTTSSQCQQNCQNWYCSANYQYYGSNYWGCVADCSKFYCSFGGVYYDYNTCAQNCRWGGWQGSCYQGSCYNTASCYQVSEYLGTLYWQANAYYQVQYLYDWRTGWSYPVYLYCSAWTNLDTYFGCGPSAYKQTRQVCTAYTYYVSNLPGGSESGYLSVNTSYPYCSNSMYRSGWQSYSYFNMSNYTAFGTPVETRVISTTNKGILYDPSQVRCRPCSTSVAGFPGQKELVFQDNRLSDNFDKLAQCTNVRMFSGEVRRCRPGGLTTLGASCCGLSGWFKNMCNNDEKELKKRRQAGTCSYVGSYCSKKVLGFCIERKRSYCCFYSRLSRIFNECGRPQVPKGWGSPKNPDCSGFTIDEFARVDFSDPVCMQAIEEWANEMAQKLGDSISQDISNRAVNGVQNWLNNVKNQNLYEGEK